MLTFIVNVILGLSCFYQGVVGWETVTKGSSLRRAGSGPHQGMFPTIKTGGSYHVCLVRFRISKDQRMLWTPDSSPFRMRMFTAIIPGVSYHCALSENGMNCWESSEVSTSKWVSCVQIWWRDDYCIAHNHETWCWLPSGWFFLGKKCEFYRKSEVNISELEAQTAAEFAKARQCPSVLSSPTLQELSFPTSLQWDEAMWLVLANTMLHFQAEAVKTLSSFQSLHPTVAAIMKKSLYCHGQVQECYRLDESFQDPG